MSNKNKVGNHVPGQQQQSTKNIIQHQENASITGFIPNMPKLPNVWQKPPQFTSNGLEHIESLDKLMILQEVNQMQALTGMSSKLNRFSVRNAAGEQIYLATLTVKVAEGNGNGRAFVIQLFDYENREIMRIIRENSGCKGCGCCICCCKSCAQEIKIETPPGQLAGYLRQAASCCSLNYGIYDVDKQFHFNLKSPEYKMNMRQIEFPILSSQNNKQVSKIIKYEGDKIQEFYTLADNYSLEFPPNSTKNLKALLLGAAFFIAYKFYAF